MGTLLRSERVRRTVREIRRLNRQSNADSVFLGEVSHLLQEVVPFEAAFWAAADPMTVLATSPSRIDGFPDDTRCHQYWQAEFVEDDVNLFRALARATEPASSLYKATCGDPARSFRYNLYREQGLGDELRGVFRVGGGTWGMFCLWRGEDGPPFSLAETQLLSNLSASFGHTFRRSALLHGQTVFDIPDSMGLLVFDRSGAVETMNDAADRWLAELPRPQFTRAGDTMPVPTEILTVVNKARAVAAGHAKGTARARVLSRADQWLAVHGFGLRDTGEDTSSRVAIVIEPATAAEIVPILLEAYELAPREQQVSRLVAQGLPTRDIATALHLSPHTVRDYLKQVFEKVEVSSRGELIAKIFAEQHHQVAPHPGPGTA